MISPLFWLLVTTLLAFLTWGAFDSRRLYRFIVFFAASFFGFVVPQLNGLGNQSTGFFGALLPEGALDQITLVSLLCVVATWLGDNRGVYHPGSGVIRKLDEYDLNRLIRVAVVFTISGVLISNIAMNVLDAEYVENLGSQWSGPITILMFFQSMQKYGLALSVFLYFRTRSPAAMLCASFNVISGLVAFTQVARRGGMADIFFMVLLGLYFGRRMVVPAWLLGTMFVLGTLWSHAIGEFRGRSDLSFLERVQNADLLGAFGYTWNNGGHELANAAIVCYSVDATGEFDFGKIHWNQLVHGYFPGQIFGAELKKAIKFEEKEITVEVMGFRPERGTTQTGMADAYQSYWYFGCLKYYIIGYVMGRWWNRANRGDLWSQLAYMSLMSAALHTITHGTYWLLNSYIHMMIFAWPCLYWSRHHLIGLEKPHPKTQQLVA